MSNASGVPLNKLIKLRKDIHKNPELGENEKNTALRIISFAKQFHPDNIISNIGGHGLAIIFGGKEKGKTVLIRCELDALPINETNKFTHRSRIENVSHKCGHDGHMTIVAGLIPLLSKNKIKNGRVVLLFQPAEETGEGAERILKDKKFKSIKPDFVFALHNLPRFEKNTILIKEKEFASASIGMIIKLNGKTSHAAEPEKGINPAQAVAEILQSIPSLPKKLKKIKDFSLITTIHVIIGEKAFGTSAGFATVMFTLRTFKNNDMKLLINESVKKTKIISKKHGLKTEISFTEEFPATVNEKNCVKLIKESAKKNGLKIKTIKTPFKWSEDFGHFTNHYRGALFGIGSGEKHPALHNDNYDFPDGLIMPGIKMFSTLINRILN